MKTGAKASGKQEDLRVRARAKRKPENGAAFAVQSLYARLVKMKHFHYAKRNS